MRKDRRKRLLEIIEEQPVSTYEELRDLLAAEGYKANISTIFKDVKDLGLVKVPSYLGIRRYALPEAKKNEDAKESFGGVMTGAAESIVSVDCAQNLVVVKTTPGMANAVAVIFDSFNQDNVLGCVAGDDTIIIVVKDNESALTVKEKIKDLSGK